MSKLLSSGPSNQRRFYICRDDTLNLESLSSIPEVPCLKQREKWAPIFNSRMDQKVKSISYRKSNRVEPLILHTEKGQERRRARGEGGKKEGENFLNLNQTILWTWESQCKELWDIFFLIQALSQTTLILQGTKIFILP